MSRGFLLEFCILRKLFFCYLLLPVSNFSFEKLVKLPFLFTI